MQTQSSYKTYLRSMPAERRAIAAVSRDCRECEGEPVLDFDNDGEKVTCEACEGTGKEFRCSRCREWTCAADLDVSRDECPDCAGARAAYEQLEAR